MQMAIDYHLALVLLGIPSFAPILVLFSDLVPFVMPVLYCVEVQLGVLVESNV